jgi:uncharacterized protein (TIGR03066 family)
MNVLRWTLASVLLLMTALLGAAQTDAAKLIVGKWERTRGDTAPPGLVAEFTRDGKITIDLKVEGKDVHAEGTYKIKGETVTLTFMVPGKDETKSETKWIKKLTETELILSDEAGKVKNEFKRVK